jgi:hypothetical protein
MATNTTTGSDKNPTDDASTTAALARESTEHFNGDRLKSWDVIESTFDATAATLHRLTEGEA